MIYTEMKILHIVSSKQNNFLFFDFEDLIGEFQERKRKIITRKKNINILD